MKKPNVLVITGYGINCEEETLYAFKIAGAQGKIIHINDLISNRSLSDYQILALPGGFSYGDDTGSGNAFANKLKNHLWEEIKSFVTKDRLVIGVCNGCQILVNLGLVPALESKYGTREVALLHNTSARYTDRWVDLTIKNQTPWFSGINELCLPIAHGEGKFFASTTVLKKLYEKKLIAARYTKGEICKYQTLEANPNGSLENVAAITDESGRILGMMPHPERAIFFTQLPNWPYLREKYQREGKKISFLGPGLKIFQNAVNYFV